MTLLTWTAGVVSRRRDCFTIRTAAKPRLRTPESFVCTQNIDVWKKIFS